MIAIDPSGQYVYVVNQNDSVSQFAIGVSGALAPMTPATVATGLDPFAITADASGAHLYVTNTAGGSGSGDTAGTISQFSIGTGGALAPISGPTVAASNYGAELTLDPSDQYAYVPNFNGNDISQYTVGSSGALTAMATPTVAAGRTPNSVAVDPSGEYLYAANSNGNTISEYTIGADGSLAPLGAPITIADTFPIWIVTLAAP
jgi:6-phosphogluconolactonase (cycloisomerase 2 family)